MHVKPCFTMDLMFVDIKKFCKERKNENVVLFMDIDNTFLRMSHVIGSDQWFRWQLRLIDNNAPKEHGRVADTKTQLCEVLQLVYERMPCEACEEDVPFILSSLCDHLPVHIVFITARSQHMFEVTQAQLKTIFGKHVIPYDLIMCSGSAKAPWIVDYLKTNSRFEKAFMIDDTLDHLCACCEYVDLQKYAFELYHYNNQLDNVVSFEKEDKQIYMAMFEKAMTG